MIKQTITSSNIENPRARRRAHAGWLSARAEGLCWFCIDCIGGAAKRWTAASLSSGIN